MQRSRPNPRVNWSPQQAQRLLDLLFELEGALADAYADELTDQAMAELNAPEGDSFDRAPPLADDDEPIPF